jgi:hypothetical protein
MLTDLPNLLTLSRIIIIPVLVGLFYLDDNVWRWVSVVLFSLAGVTDYFDGYLARKGRRSRPRALPRSDRRQAAGGGRHPHARGHPSRPGLVGAPALVILCRSDVRPARIWRR